MVHAASIVDESTIGRWDEDLFRRFRRAKGDERRALLEALLKVNKPLVKVLVGQLAGIADEKTTSRKRRPTRMRVIGADQVPWEDLMQAGLQGMAHALGKFDPSKGKISGYARWWILTNLQRLVKKEALIKAPDGETPLGVSLVDFQDREALDKMGVDLGTPDQEERGVEDRHSLEELHGWEKRGQWPEGLEDVRAQYLKEFPERERRPVYSVPRRPLDVFLEVRCMFGSQRNHRAPTWPLWNAWRLHAEAKGIEEGTRDRFLGAIGKRGAIEKRIRPVLKDGRRGEPMRGLWGLKLVG